MKHTKKYRRRRRGGYYGAAGAIAPGANAMQWNAGSEMGAFTADQINNGAKMTGGRRRRKSRRKTRRGGGKYGGVSAGFTGDGTRGMARYVGSSTRTTENDAALGAFNDNGAHGGDFGSFGGMFPK